MVNPLSIPTAAPTNPLSIPGGTSTPAPIKSTSPVQAKTAPKPFAATPLGIATNTILGIPHAALGLAQDAGLAPGGKTPFAATPVGTAANTVLGLPRSATHVGAEIGRGIARDTLGLGRTIQNTIAPGSAPESQMPSAHLKALLGDQAIETIPTQFNTTKAAIDNSDIAKKIGLNKFSGPLAFGAVIGNNILDFAPIGGEDAAIKNLVKETDPHIIQALLEKTGVHPAIAEKFAPHFAEANNSKEIKTLLKTVKGTQMLKHTAEAREALQHEPDLSYEPTDEESFNQMAQHEVNSAPESGIDEGALHEYNKLEPATPDEATTNIPTHLEPLAEQARESGSPEAFRQDMSDLQDKYIKGEPLTKKESDLLSSLKAAKHDRIGTASEFFDRAVKSGESKIPEELQPLAEEAKKYKTADEFIGSHDKLYRGGSGFDENRITDIGSSFTRNEKVANSFASRSLLDHGSGSIADAYLSKNAKLLKFADLPENLKNFPGKEKGLEVGDSHLDKVAKYARDNGFDAVDLKDFDKKTHFGTLNEDEVRVLNRDALMTEGELRDLHAQATKGSTESVLPTTEKSPGNIGKMDSTIEEQFARRAASTPGATIQKLAKGPDAKSWQSLIRGFSRNMTKQEKAHALDYFATPEFVLEKLGLQKGAEMLQDARDLYHKNLKKEFDKIIAWHDQVKSTPDSSRRIFKYLDGQAKDVRHEMTDTEYKIAQEIKSYLKSWAQRLNLPEDKQISNYITHIFEKGDISLDDKESPFSDPDLATIMEAQPAKSVYDPFLEKRVNKQGYRQDVWAALDAYTKRATRKEAMDPALERVALDAKKLEGDAYQYVANLTHNINMRPTKIDGLVDNLITKFAGTRFTDRPVAYLTNKIRTMFYRGTIGLNLASALRNLSQGANTYAKLGEKYTIVGYTKIMSGLATRNLAELYEHGVLDDAIQDKKIGVYKNILQRIDPILFKMFDVAEKINRGAAYYGAKSRAIDKGLTEDQAIKYAKRMVRETQFSFGAIDSPVALGGDVVKTALQLQSYNIKQIEFFTRMIQNKEYGGLMRWTAASLAFVYSIGRAFGMTPIQLLPGVGLGGGSGSPTVNFFDGLSKLGSTNAQTKAQGQQEVSNTVIETIPAGVQMKKTVQGLNAYGKGKDVTASGNTRYKIPHDTQHLIQAALFGKSALPEAQQYYKKLNSPKSKKSANNPLSV